MGQKFAAYNATGAIIAYFDDIDSPVPAGADAVEISDAQWQACLSTPGWTVQNGALVAPEPPTAAELLATAQAAQIATLQQGCAAAIVSGFASQALGAVFQYPSTLTDQQNQSTVANCASGGKLWCSDGSTWGLNAHTQTEAQAVVASFATWLNSCQDQLMTLTNQVNAATTPDAVQAVAWAAPAKS